MTQQQFITQFKTGDFNALWAAVENHISGETNKIRDEASATEGLLAAEIEALKGENAKLETLVHQLQVAPKIAGSTLTLDAP